jgi:PKD repeat protein
MSNKKVNIEELYRSQFEEFTTEPSAGLWTRIRYKLMWHEFFRFSLNTFNAYYLGAAIAITAGGIILITQLNKPYTEATIPVPPTETAPSPEVTGSEQPQSTPEDRQGMSTERRKSSRTEARKTSESGSQGEKQVSETGKISASEIKSSTGSEQLQPERINEGTPETSTGTGEKLTASASFDMSCESGCAPLAVNFMNRSVNASRYYWTFGDGGCSEDQNPGYVFDEPGDYTVSLKVTGADGLEYTALSEIKVHNTPKANFEYDAEVNIAKGEPVNFYNYSKDADFYEWDFGDNSRSKLTEPVHYYDSPGKYNVKLIAWTTNLCYDSMTIKNAFTPTAQEIVFPNAFTPNMNGPVGGHYELNDPENKVFYPIITGDILEYNLRIFNRVGYLVFESSDPAIGWDGYYEDQLSAQGVYIWKVRGSFANGKSFLKSGDVTLIWIK